MFLLAHEHGFSLLELGELAPYELEIYKMLVIAHIEEKARAQENR